MGVSQSGSSAGDEFEPAATDRNRVRGAQIPLCHIRFPAGMEDTPSPRTEESGIRFGVHQTRSRSHAENAEGRRPQGCAERRPRRRRGLE